VSTDFQQIVKSKEAERRRLRELPWLEKMEMLDRWRVRHLLLRGTSVVRWTLRRNSDLCQCHSCQFASLAGVWRYLDFVGRTA